MRARLSTARCAPSRRRIVVSRDSHDQSAPHHRHATACFVFLAIASTRRVDAQAPLPPTENKAPDGTPPKPGEAGAAGDTPSGGPNAAPTPGSPPSSPAAPEPQVPAAPPAPAATSDAPRPATAPLDAALAPVVVTAQTLDEALPAQLSSYGTRVDRVSAEQIQHGGYADVAQSLETSGCEGGPAQSHARAHPASVAGIG
jgi:hypothetical protein